MFALMVSVDYEGSDLLGVYSSLSAAMVAAQRYMEADELWGDTMEIFEMAIDAEASDSFYRYPAWSVRR